MPAAVIAVFSISTVALLPKDMIVTLSLSPITSTMTLDECLARSKRVKRTPSPLEGSGCVARLSIEPEMSSTMMQWMGARCGLSTA